MLGNEMISKSELDAIKDAVRLILRYCDKEDALSLLTDISLRVSDCLFIEIEEIRSELC